ncbi:hypothetical protein QCA50_002420 [Cerrena zonata]|uniref:C2H2-type domain-containing protein n=1 Tax=Cerrena zonata TaxID=2478898 RepID=A0AAW0GYX7_9APHY
MHSTLYALPQHVPFHPRNYRYSPAIYQPAMASSQPSYLRSSAGRTSRPQGYPTVYPNAYGPVQDDDLLVAGTPSSAGSASSASVATECSSQEQVQGYNVQPEYDFSSASNQSYAAMDMYPRTKWSGELHGLHHDYVQPSYDQQSMPISPAGMAGIPTFETSPSDSFINAYGSSPTANYTFQPTYSPQQAAAQEYVRITTEQPPTFQLPSPVEVNTYSSSSESPPQFVSMSEVSPSPTISPKLLLQHVDQLPQEGAANATAASYSGTEGINSSADGEYDVDEDTTVMQTSPVSDLARGTRSAPSSPPKKRRRKVSYTSSEDSDNRSSGESDSDESDFMKEESADEDDDYTGPQARRRSVRRCASVIETSSMPSPRRIPIPVPVPNLTKKSRGRRVPTEPILIAQDGIVKNTRMYLCDVSGCGKRFARGEHLKRHIRSIHTNEKPHKCPYPGCGKNFSRHDNLGQHMRVHKGFKLPRS